jgi:hypothetical protein
MVELSATLLAGILAAQIAQIGFEAQLLRRLSTVETKVAERTTPAHDGSTPE